jgi:hypothetical protein
MGTTAFTRQRAPSVLDDIVRRAILTGNKAGLVGSGATNSRLAWEGHTLHTPDREVGRHYCLSDPWRAPPSIRTNPDFGSDSLWQRKSASKLLITRSRAKKAPRERGLSRRNVERENRTCGIDRQEEASFAAAPAM